MATTTSTIIERIFPNAVARAAERHLPAIREELARAAERHLPAIREELARRTAAEATSAGETDYAFRHLSANAPGGAGGQLTLPQPFLEDAMRQSHWQYETHGLAYLIISRMVSIIFEAGLQYTVTFDEAVPMNVQAAIRRRLEEFWNSEDTDMQDRAREFVLECLLSGEHGWRFYVDQDNGAVEVGDIPRTAVEDILVDARDRRRVGVVRTRADASDASIRSEDLRAIRLCKEDGPNYKHLHGDVLYYRLDTRSSKKRGSPVLQRVVDELRAEKRFLVLATDRFVERMKTFVSVTLNGASLEQVKAYSEAQPKSIPTGTWYGNDKVTRELHSANLEGAEITAIIRTLITIILGSFGMPISWAGFGDGSTKATSETQQEPAAQDSRRTKGGILGTFQKALYFVADQFIVHNPQVHQPLQMIMTHDPATKTESPRLLRDCITINVATKPLEERKPEGTPLAATDAAFKIIAADDLRASETQQRLLDDETVRALVNYAFSRDGVGIEIEKPDETAQIPDPEQKPAA